MTSDTPRCFCSLLKLGYRKRTVEGDLTGYDRPLEEEGPLRGGRDLITVINRCDDWRRGVRAGEQAVVNDRTHGVQFRADFLRSTPPTTAEEIEKSSPRV